MERHFLLSFGTTLGRTRTLRINNVNPTVTDANMRNSMNTMIASQAISTHAAGRINSLRRAQSVMREIQPVDIFG